MNAHEGRVGVVLLILQVKLCDPRLSALSVVATIKALYTYTSFLFLYLAYYLTYEISQLN